jgi:serpin B
MRHGTIQMSYAAVDGMTVVELPYTDDSLVMTVLLPDAGRFEEQIDALDATRLASLPGQTSSVRVKLGLPKLDMRYALDLIPLLESFGMTDAFDWRTADLTGMDGGYGTLFINQVLHQATAEVMESGTVASAATGVVVNEFDAGAPPPDDLVVDVDRPYVILIRDRPTEGILFLGQILDPLG